MDSPIRLLIVDDDRALGELLDEFLRPLGFAVEAVHEFSAGHERALSGEFAIAVLDVMLPGGSGFELLKAIRARSRMPIMMLTARGEEVDRIVGLEIGADDYLPKPFNPRELAARLTAILRRAGSAPPSAPLPEAMVVVDDVELDPGARVVRRSAQRIDLTSTQFALLEVLLRSAGRVVSRDELSRRVLGRPSQPYDRSIDMHVSHVRRKLGPGAENVERIQSVRGEGYVYVLAEVPRAALEAAADDLAG